MWIASSIYIFIMWKAGRKKIKFTRQFDGVCMTRQSAFQEIRNVYTLCSCVTRVHIRYNIHVCISIDQEKKAWNKYRSINITERAHSAHELISMTCDFSETMLYPSSMLMTTGRKRETCTQRAHTRVCELRLYAYHPHAGCHGSFRCPCDYYIVFNVHSQFKILIQFSIIWFQFSILFFSSLFTFTHHC